MRKEYKIPTILGLLLMIIGLGALIFAIERGTSFLSRASGMSIPKEVALVNITDTSFAVSWVTATPTQSFVSYQEQTPLGSQKTAFDIRDTTGSVALRYTHFVSISGLKPQTNYKVTLGKTGNKELSYLATTGTTLPAPTHIVDPTFGTLLDQNNRSVKEALVYTSFPGSQTLGSIVDPDGSWVLALGGLRTGDGTRYFIPTKQDPETLAFVTSSGRTEVETTIDADSPLPPVRLDDTHRFTTFKKSPFPRPVIAQSQHSTQISANASGPFSVTLPKANSSLTSNKPAFKGSGVVGKKVIITLTGGFAPVVGTTTVLANGSWNWTPPTLSPNPYMATIASFSEKDEPLALTIPFTILKSGSQVLQAATPSASLAPTPEPSATPGIGGGPTPRPSPTVTASPLVSPLASPAASIAPSPSPMPDTGTAAPTWILLVAGVLVLTLGIRGFAAKTGSP